MALHPNSYAIITQDGKVITEYDTFTCAHGNEIVRIKPGTANEAPMCRKCMQRICLKCQKEMNLTLKCVPFEERLKLMESNAARIRRRM